MTRGVSPRPARAGIVLYRPLRAGGLRVHAHAAEFIEREFFSFFSDAHLAVDYRAARGQRDEERDDDLEWQENNAERQCTDKLRRAFERIIKTYFASDIFQKPRLLHTGERYFAHDELVEADEVGHYDAGGKKIVEHRDERGLVLELVRNDDEVDAFALGDLLYLSVAPRTQLSRPSPP